MAKLADLKIKTLSLQLSKSLAQRTTGGGTQRISFLNGTTKETKMSDKVWTTNPLRLSRERGVTLKPIPAGTCLLIADEQWFAEPGFTVVFGAGCFDVVANDNLTFKENIR